MLTLALTFKVSLSLIPCSSTKLADEAYITDLVKQAGKEAPGSREQPKSESPELLLMLRQRKNTSTIHLFVSNGT